MGFAISGRTTCWAHPCHAGQGWLGSVQLGADVAAHVPLTSEAMDVGPLDQAPQRCQPCGPPGHPGSPPSWDRDGWRGQTPAIVPTHPPCRPPAPLPP